MTNSLNINYSDKQLQEALESLNSNGFYCLRGAIGENLQKKFRKDIKKLVEFKGNRYFSIVDIISNPDLSFRIIDKDTDFKSFMTSLSKQALKREVLDTESLNVLRVVSGKESDSQSFKFHYDAYAVTALIPIIIPNDEIESSGHLVSFPNMRKLRSSFFINLIEKFIFQNRFMRNVLSKKILSNLDKYVYVIKPGNIYLFWGYRTLHANLQVGPLLNRATLLYHMGDVHPKSALDRFIKHRRHTSEKENSNKVI